MALIDEHDRRAPLWALAAVERLRMRVHLARARQPHPFPKYLEHPRRPVDAFLIWPLPSEVIQADVLPSWSVHVSTSCLSRCSSRVARCAAITFVASIAAVVLIDESHVSAHCYADSGQLAIDAFTCGSCDADVIADHIHTALTETIPDIRLLRRRKLDRFLDGDD